jgi:hypothetical protein
VPWTGTLIGAPGSAATAGALVAPSDVDVLEVATWAAQWVGCLLVPNRRGERAPRRFLREARIRGVTPLVPWTLFDGTLEAPPPSAVVLVEDATEAEGLALPVVATWS